MTIATTCQCGKKYQVKEELAGKRVKCPACGGTLSIPGRDPAKPQSDVSQSDSNFARSSDKDDFDDYHLEPAADLPLSKTPSPTKLVSHARKSKGTKRNSSRLVTVAGWVAVLFGGWLVLSNGLQLLSTVVACIRAGALPGLGGYLTLVFLALGYWMGKSGLDIIGDVEPEEALRQAAVAIVVYLPFGILNLVLLGIGYVVCMFIAPLFAVFLAFIAGLNLICIFAAAFIVYANWPAAQSAFPLKWMGYVAGGFAASVVAGIVMAILAVMLSSSKADQGSVAFRNTRPSDSRAFLGGKTTEQEDFFATRLLFKAASSLQDSAGQAVGVTLHFPLSVVSGPSHQQPPGMALPGFAYSYPVEAGHIYIGAVPLTKNIDAVMADIKAEVNKVIPGVEWADAQVDSPDVGNFSSPRISGADSEGNRLDIYLVTSATHHVFVGWRAPKDKSDFFTTSEYSMGTIKVAGG
jgi:hypothetical protein